MTSTPHPYFSFFPALPLSKSLRLGEWVIGSPGKDVAWRSQRFKELALSHLKSFAKLGFKNGALMWHRDRGFDGSMPEPEVWTAIRATVCFVALDANDHLRDDPNAAHYIATSENAELYTQPFDETSAFITQQQGGLLKRMLTGGSKIGEEAVSLPDAVLAIMQPVIPSQRLATALFDALIDASKPVNRRIGIALEWHRFALSNPRVVSWPQRLISLKTGFEALSGESKTHLCAKFLRMLFEDVTRPYVNLLPWAGLLWSPRERCDLARTWLKGTTPQHVVRSELEDWFQALGEARNEIIHEGAFSSGVYDAPAERPQSRYAGPLFWTADRLLRETVKALLGSDVLLCARIAEAAASKKVDELLADAFQELKAKADAVRHSPMPTPQTTPELPSSTRDVATLLASLRCDAANKVRLAKVVAQPSATEEGASENSLAARDAWSAAFDRRSMLINGREKDALEQAGAEFALPRSWSRCE